MPNLSCGIVGLPNVGKSTLFNALTRQSAPASNYPFCTIDPNIGIVNVPDKRVDALAQISHSAKIVYASMQFVDIAGLVAGASKGEGLGNKFLANIRETDAIVHVVRCFEQDDVVHVAGRIDPVGDVEVINLELILADLQSVENSLQRVQKQAKGRKDLEALCACLEKVLKHLNENRPVRSCALTAEEQELLKPYPLLTSKKMLYLANVDESSLPSMENRYVQKLREFADKEGSQVVTICAHLEEQIGQLDEADQPAFLESVGLSEPGLNRLIRASFSLLGLITFLTTGEQESRAWPIVRGTTAPQAAGTIHTDLQKGFIRAEVISFDDVVKYQGRAGARDAGRLRSEGKEYIVQDGDVILFLHN